MTFLLGTWLEARNRNAAVGAHTRRGANRTRPHRIVPRLEALEDRMVPNGGYVQTNLVSDIPNLAGVTDPNLKNPWAIAQSPHGPFSVTDQKTNISTQYSVTDEGVSKLPLEVAIPKTAAGPQGPTGQVYNGTSSFLVNGTPASFIFANLNGTISAWNSSAGTTAQVAATTTGAIYAGLDIESTDSGDFLYAANSKQGRIDVFDGSFNRVTLAAGAFVDPQLPSGLVPFNVEGIKGDLYVAYAPAGRANQIAAPEGVGAVAVFDTSGNFVKQLISGGKLASPWGMIVAPERFGEFGGDLLVGNFSFKAAEINAFDPESGEYQGTLSDNQGITLLNNAQGLWDMTFGTGGNGGRRGTLYVATGLNNENDGLFAAIAPAREKDEHGDDGAKDSGASHEASHNIITDHEWAAFGAGLTTSAVSRGSLSTLPSPASTGVDVILPGYGIWEDALPVAGTGQDGGLALSPAKHDLPSRADDLWTAVNGTDSWSGEWPFLAVPRN